MKNILVIGAHFDDAELGAGGSMRKWSDEGKKVYKLTLTDNETNFEQYNLMVDYHKTKNESALASEVLGVVEIADFSPEKCNQLVYSTELMQKIEKIIYDLQIDTVVIHSSEDANQDHIEASKICVTAARHCDNILFFKSNGYLSETGFLPNYFVDISKYIELKKKALEVYSSANNRQGRLFDSCIERNHFYGYSVGVEYAEPFKVLRMVEK